MQYLLTPHRNNTAGYFFDVKIAKNLRLKIIDCSKDSTPLWVQVIFMLLTSIFLGKHTSLYISRILYSLIKRRLLWDCFKNPEDFILSRTIVPFFKNYIVHNNEQLYYYEEANSSTSITAAIINYHQVFCLCVMQRLIFTEKVSLLIFLARHELRYYRRKYAVDSKTIFLKENFKVSFNFENTLQPSCAHKVELMFFGDFSNVRNISMLKSIIKEYGLVKVFGRNTYMITHLDDVEILGEYKTINDLKKYTLVIHNAPRSGVQTKIVEFMSLGGSCIVETKIIRRLV